MLINDDVIKKICFIYVYGCDVAEMFVTEIHFETDIKTYNLKEIRKRIPFDNVEFAKIRNGIIFEYKKCSEVNIIDGFSHTMSDISPIGFYSDFYAVSEKSILNPTSTSTNFWVKEIMWKLDMFDIYYKYPFEYIKIKENSLPEIEWKLDALHLYLTMQKGVRDTIISEHKSVVDDFKSQREETIRQQEEAYANFQKECKIIEEQNKIRERERKKALKEEAKRRMTLEAKMESHEIYGEIIYKGEMYVIKSKSDLKLLLERLS